MRKRQQTRHSVITGAGVTAGAVLGLSSPALAASYTVTDLADPGNGVCDSDCTLREAVTAANAHPGLDQVVFRSGLSGAITLDGTQIAAAGPIGIYGPGANVLTVSGANASRVFDLQSGGPVTIAGLTVTKGSTAGGGGGIYNAGAVALTIQNSTVSGNTTTGNGGGIYSNGGSMTLQRSTVSGNSAAGLGAGVRLHYSGATIQDSTISSNLGYGMSLSHSSPTIQSSTMDGNAGHGIYEFYSHAYLTSTVVADSIGSDVGVGLFSALSAGFSLIENTAGTSITATGPNLAGIDPALGNLAPNGGPTLTQFPTTSSPLLDKGSGGLTDQRGKQRPFDVASIPNASGGNGADIGAVELQTTDFPASTPAPGTKKKCKKAKKRSARIAKKKCRKKK